MAVFAANNAVAAQTLKVALYPWVPRIDQFKQAIEIEWKKVQPEVAISWADEWDGGYNKDPEVSYDVYVFDAVYFDYFKSKGWLIGLKESQIENWDDILEYARKGVTEDGQIYAIPQIGCGSILFYHKNDTVLAKATTLNDVTSAIGSCVFYGQHPPSSNIGLMLDLSGGTTNACNYIESVHEKLNQYPVPMPENPQEVDKTAISNIQSALASSSFRDAYYEGSNAYIRAEWFNRGNGRAYIGFTESLSELGEEPLQNVAFKPMPWSNNLTGNNSPLFYSDVIGIQPETKSRGTEALAVQLANLMASASVIVQSFGPSDSKGPQYLMPVRTSVFQQLGSQFPIYSKLYQMVSSVSPILFKLDANSKEWLQKMKPTIKNMIMADPGCYTDIEAGPIWNDEDAQQKCPDVCEEHGGWNGQWKTIIPGKMSVCGCCEASQTKK